ncbi:2-oxo-4-hydroxy-4-carboxy-5-ureidoimidazoline decarboxylase [Streptomyces sp. NPDC047000]|uniref:2-oxo-4-hydroxy-4-carboxy-5-ureidoimidazoline decarboxylase n=1 Tax=Streptomyces sp. NPDC047000 TaxID=3155474 RepID=UPI0033EE1F41
MTLTDLNTAPADEARRTLLACLPSPRWADRMAAHRPYPDLAALLAASDEAAYDLTPEDVTAALGREPLPDGAGTVGPPRPTYSTYLAARTALSAAHSAYAAKFGHPFVICLAEVAPEEALDRTLEGIRSRLANDPDEERAVAAEQLRRLARARLGHALAPMPGD